MSAVTATARSLAQLTAGFVQVPADLMVSDLTLDSRAATPGAVFLACSGRTHHGLKFAAEAVARGARAVLYEDQGVAELPQLAAGTWMNPAVSCASEWLVAAVIALMAGPPCASCPARGWRACPRGH